MLNFWCNRNLPSGPFFSPFFGPKSSEPVYSRLTGFAKKFGGIFSYSSFNHKVIVISDISLGRKLFKEDLITCRPFSVLEIESGEDSGDLNAETRNPWLTIREFYDEFQNSIDFKSIGEDESAYLLSAAHECKNGPIDIEKLLRKCFTNIIAKIFFGRRLEYDEERMFSSFGRLGSTHAKGIYHLKWLGASRTMLTLVPKLRKGIKEARSDMNENRRFIWDQIQLCENKVEQQDSCFVREFLTQQHPESDIFSDSQLLDCIYEVFSEVPESMTVTLLWAIYLAAKHENIQNTIVEEANAQFYTTSEPNQPLSLPKCESFILETLRYGCIRSYSSHMAEQDFFLEETGNRFPKKTMFLFNYWAMNRNNAVYSNPANFNPERFLDQNEKIRIPPEAEYLELGFQEFMKGKIVRTELVLIFSSLIREFRISFFDDDKNKGLTPEPTGALLYPPPLKLNITLRDEFE